MALTNRNYWLAFLMLRELLQLECSMDVSLFQSQESKVDTIDSTLRRHSLLNPVLKAEKELQPTLANATKKIDKVQPPVKANSRGVWSNKDEKDNLLIKSSSKDLGILHSAKNVKDSKDGKTKYIEKKIPVTIKANKEKTRVNDIYDDREVRVRDAQPSDRITEKDKNKITSPPPKTIKCNSNEKAPINASEKNSTAKLSVENKHSNRDRTDSCSSYGSLHSVASEYESIALNSTELERIPSPVRKMFEVKSKVSILIIWEILTSGVNFVQCFVC